MVTTPGDNAFRRMPCSLCPSGNTPSIEKKKMASRLASLLVTCAYWPPVRVDPKKHPRKATRAMLRREAQEHASTEAQVRTFLCFNKSAITTFIDIVIILLPLASRMTARVSSCTQAEGAEVSLALWLCFVFFFFAPLEASNFYCSGRTEPIAMGSRSTAPGRFEPSQIASIWPAQRKSNECIAFTSHLDAQLRVFSQEWY
ncbi:hypothetical protein BGZ63DRAFT_38052 [Mariannaea sp. PMI_226]|nr:hypothetical protein BGZ63DRAFT_38052 [Mariannaea sp. PMI_226]